MGPDVEQEFRAFVARATPELFRVAFALTGAQHAAEDLLQTALERLVTRWHRVEDPDGYVRRVMYHEYVSWWRRRRWREVPVAVLPDLDITDDPAQLVVLRRALAGALRTLAPRQRAVLVLRYLEDRSEAEVAALLGCSVKTVSSQASRAMAQLRAACGPFLEVRPKDGAR
ncbi:SigE family RNA polymerase sigma factor [Catellatospora sp. TT07R-123]|uniref:SigE family RNA polymerase sigma factor n=1 Tax=Catellatospora sp. TT07R-123 TaxID=2733863 RepID=UPI001BB3398E|nr:SigE family RNA polymerase sigma factor [Catellatospora sp. TT07R-123]